MIEKVVLENWKTHRKSEFEFGKGTNVLVGIIGSGKTSVMDAICFALFGTFPSLNSKRVSLNEVIMNRPNEMDHARVGLDFTYKGKKYSIERTINRVGSSQAKLLHDGRLIAGPKTTDVRKKVEEIIEVNYDLFSRGVYSEQNAVDYFLRLNPGQRKERFDELLQLNRYEASRAGAVALNNRLKRTVEERKAFVKEQEEKIDEKALKEQRERLAKKENQIAEAEKGLKEAEDRVKAVEKQAKALEEKEKRARQLAEARVKEKARAEQLSRDVEEAEKGLAGKTLADVNQEMEKTAEKKRKAEEDVKRLEERGKAVQEKISSQRQEKAVLQEKKKELAEGKGKLKTAGASCPVCRKQLTEDSRKEIESHYMADLEKIESQTGLAAEKEKKLLEESKAVEREKGERAREVEGLKERAAELRAIVERVEAVERKLKETALSENRARELEKQLEGLGFDEQEARKLREECVRLKTGHAARQNELKSARELAAEIRQNIKKAEEAGKAVEKEKERVRQIEGTVEKIVLFTNALKATQAELRAVLIDNVNSAMDDIWERLYPYDDFTSTKIELVEGNYEIMVKRSDGKWVRVEGILSGGERSAVAITLRIAISLVLTQNLSWLILDEPTHNLDSLAIREFSRMLKEHLPELVEQVFIITHDKEMEKAASANVYLLERDKEADGPTRVVVEALE